ncbi:MAG TPA: DUF2157 domain-containing protein [Blastocatellia bacterium]|nr:DUF2157 domain-containing protein [Blastocatellia bacterium]
MSEYPQNASISELTLSAEDIRRAAGEDVLSLEAAESLLQWGYRQRAAITPPSHQTHEQRKGLNLVTVAYYFGAMLMISACAWFLGDKWDALGSKGILATSLIYAAVTLSAGWWLRRKGYVIGGGLLITVGVCLTPLLVYTIEDMAGVWPGTRPGAYENYYPWIHGSWIVMELATIAVAAFALRFVRFSFLTAPIAFSFWFLSMDAAAWALNQPEGLNWNSRRWVSVVVGLITMLVGFGLDRTLHKPDQPRSEDFAFWCYLFGLMAFWGGLTAMESASESGRAIYALVNLGLIALAVKLRRVTFLVFGAMGVYAYLGHLAYEVFKDSVFFPFTLALIGLSLILATVWAQRRLLRAAH